MRFLKPPKNDLRKVDLPRGDWQNPDQALAEVHVYCIEQAKDAEQWYMRERQSKRLFGRWLRAISILLVGAAAVIPILAEIYTNEGKPEIAPIWASLALVLAALLVALDKFFGFSTAWTRFIATNLEITRLRHNFEFEWQTLQAEEADSTELLELAREFILAVDDAVANEVLAWSEEFKSSLDSATDKLRSSG